jgi:hypothetical protein
MVCPYRIKCGANYEPYSRCRIAYKLCKIYDKLRIAEKEKQNHLEQVVEEMRG